MNYINVNTESETEDVCQEIWKYCGGYLGCFCPFNWSFRPAHRSQTLVKMILTFSLLGSFLVLLILTIQQSVDFDQTYMFVVILALNFAVYPLLLVISNYTNRSSVCSLYDVKKTGAFEYGDFSGDQEISLRRHVYRQWHFYHRIFLPALVVVPILLALLAIDNNRRDPKTLPYWFDPRFPLPVWLPKYTINSIILDLVLLLELSFVAAFSSYIYAYALSSMKMGMTLIFELKLITEAIRKLEERAVVTYLELLSHLDIPFDGSSLDLIKLHEDSRFRTIYNECMKKIIRHHQNILLLIENINKVYGSSFLYGEYTLGLGLAFLIYIMLDESKSLDVRVFTFIILIFLYSFISSFCIVCQKANDNLLALHEEIYMGQWIHADESFKKLIRIFQIRTLKPKKIKSYFSGTPMDLSYVITMTKACYTMINFILIMRES